MAIMKKNIYFFKTKNISYMIVKPLFMVLFLISCFLLQVSCSKLLEVDPPLTNTTDASLFNEDNKAIAVLNGLYTKWSNADGLGSFNLSVIPGLSADELSLWSGKSDLNIINYYKNSLTTQYGGN